ncbi:MAG: 1-acyl-sn-glycerol-3-phosphate acyltransferase [Deltaproteobacteria bacterium]|nr:1-acyl-sn-glycerol-3-phosphate acyltransferase [Deltaproteobacteria bacterium]
MLKGLLKCGYFSLETEGLENIPRRGRTVFVCNHSGWFTLDTFFVGMVMMEKAGVDLQKMPYGIALDVLCRVPILKDLFSLKHSFIPSSWLKSPGTMPSGVQSIGVYPEGSEGNCKPFWQAYRMKPWKTGFVRFALERRAKIVPIVIVGGEETFPSLWVTEKLRALLGSKFPIPAVPFPLPAKWKVAFMKPIDLAKYPKKTSEDRDACRQIAQEIQWEVQGHLDRQTKDRSLAKLSKFAGRMGL